MQNIVLYIVVQSVPYIKANVCNRMKMDQTVPQLMERPFRGLITEWMKLSLMVLSSFCIFWRMGLCLEDLVESRRMKTLFGISGTNASGTWLENGL